MQRSLSDDPDWQFAIDLAVALRRGATSAAEPLQEDATMLAEYPTHTPLPVTVWSVRSAFTPRRILTKPPNWLEFGGGPAGNRTRMLGLEDRCFVH